MLIMEMQATRRSALLLAMLVLLGIPAWADGAKPDPEKVELTDKQTAAIKIETAAERLFAVEIDAVGSIDFNQDALVQIFPNYPGKIIETFAKLGDAIKKGQPLYTIESPDLIAAESTLIAAAASVELTSKALTRARTLFDAQGLAEKDLEQAVSDQQTADAALKAARSALLLFGKSTAQIDRIIKDRRLDAALVVVSPVTGQVTARNAQPGLLVEPGSAPAPFTVADLRVVWMLASVPENESPRISVGQTVKVTVPSLPDHLYNGKLVAIAANIDPVLHIVVARSEVDDPKHELRPGMIASFRIQTDAPQRSVALPVNGVVREGDGTMTAWTTTDRHHFIRRTVKVGLQQGGFRQIIEGVKQGELIVTDGAILLSNMAAGSGPS
jgi:cobalt-zinc-cadmium efflux system membrane fusion protein